MTPPRLHSYPDAAEILAAVREFLLDHVAGATGGTVSFHARVAANLLAMLEREYAAGPEAQTRFEAALRSLEVRDERELALRLRADAQLSPSRDLLDTLAMITRDRLLVANPGYLDNVDDLDDDPRGHPRQ